MRNVSIGDHFGHLTIVGNAERGPYGQMRYRCSCDCGNEIVVDKGSLFSNPNRRCKKCYSPKGRRKDLCIVGKEINGWFVIREIESDKRVRKFECKCMRCGNVSIHSAYQITSHCSDRCAHCPPKYDFGVYNGIAVGSLPNGEQFIVDAEMIPLVNAKFWRRDKDGYIVSVSKDRRDYRVLHREIMGVHDTKTIIDHINRDRMDCRKCNLRIVNNTQNSCNHKMFSTNKTGYTGVYYSSSANRYEAKVGYRSKRIYLGSSRTDIVLLAQMYNIAALYIYGRFAGELNDVPTPSDKLTKSVISKCEKYIEAPARAGAFFEEAM